MSIIIEIIYEGDHCIPCVYMLETVEEAIGDMGDRVKLELVYLRQETGGRRYRELSEGLGGPAPIPSIFINGKLYFSTTPSVEELRQTLQGLLQAGE